MATYAELLSIATTPTGSSLRDRITVAVVVACEAIRTEADTTPNHANRMKWAADVLRQPGSMAERTLWAVLAQNKGATVAQITGADDATVQTAVNNAVNLLAQG